MSVDTASLPLILSHSPTRIEFGPGKLWQLGATARSFGASHVLLVTDPGIQAAGHVERAIESLRNQGLQVTVFDRVEENPTTNHVADGVSVARESGIDFIVGLGGGSSLDCAKGINLILTNGGKVRDYWGVNKPVQPMLPFIAVPTTAGTGSEAQSFALIADAKTHQKMACGDRRLPSDGGLRPCATILDPDLTRTTPAQVAFHAGIDAVSHAIETSATNERNEMSMEASREAWKRLDVFFERALTDPDDGEARTNLLLGAHVAGFAIENSMLGAAHSCANPLTARFGVPHGLAVGVVLPAVIRFNTADGTNPYAALSDDPEALASRIEYFLSLRDARTRMDDYLGDAPSWNHAGVLESLADEAAGQWTAQFNPTPVGSAELLQVYRAAFC